MLGHENGLTISVYRPRVDGPADNHRSADGIVRVRGTLLILIIPDPVACLRGVGVTAHKSNREGPQNREPLEQSPRLRIKLFAILRYSYKIQFQVLFGFIVKLYSG